jgi:ribonuclease D
MIDTDEQLARFLPSIVKAEWLALDTEADSLHAYPEKICLIQISTVAGDKLIDPLAGLNIAPLLEALNDHVLIMHGADYDLRLFRKHHSFVPRAIFDTMLAARLLGHVQFGLSNLVSHYLGVTLDKGSQKADWARRPLTPKMENYARNDTHYLKLLSDKLRVELEQKGRLAWHQESCDQLIEECAEEKLPDPDKVWRVKGSNILGRQALGVLRELWRWRENEALAANRPPYFILPHDALIKIAASVVNGEKVQSLIPSRFSERRRNELKHAIERGLKLAEHLQPHPLRPMSRRQTEDEKRRFVHLQRRRDERASELGIDATLIASKAMLLALAEDWDANQNELMNWQRELLK